jgi:hypothetical protein
MPIREDVIGGFNPVDAAIPAPRPRNPANRAARPGDCFTTNNLFYSVRVQQVATNTAALGVGAPTYKGSASIR